MIELPACARCGHPVFPAHLRCARCGSIEWTSVSAGGATLEAVTVVRRSLVAAAKGAEPPRIGLVATDAGPRVIARVSERVLPGERVTLRLDGGAPVAGRALERG